MKENRACKVFVLLLVLALSVIVALPAPVSQAQTQVVNHTLTFHGYSVVLRDANNSLIVYDGADGAAASGAGSQVTLESQISGTRDGWSYWSAVAMWVIPLQNDVHVKGTVSIRAYISSTFSLSGLFSGGSYGFGVVDIDENNNKGMEFVSEGPIAIGKNPFTQEPAQYSLNVNVDYVFKKGHSIGLAIGFGSTVQGFDATVYFDSPSRNSGATLPVQETTTSQTFVAQSGGASHNVQIASTSAVSDFQYDDAAKRISFKAQGIPYTTCSCEVVVPKTLLQPPFKVSMGSQQLSASTTEDSTNTRLTFTHTRTSETLSITGDSGASPSPTASATSTATSSTIVPEYPVAMHSLVVVGAFLVSMLIGMVLWVFKSRKLSQHTRNQHVED
jgi:hypothetical protein